MSSESLAAVINCRRLAALARAGPQQIIDMHNSDRLPSANDEQCSDVHGIQQF